MYIHPGWYIPILFLVFIDTHNPTDFIVLVLVNDTSTIIYMFPRVLLFIAKKINPFYFGLHKYLKLICLINFGWQTRVLFQCFVYTIKLVSLIANYLNSTMWISLLLIILSNDIQLNPGPTKPMEGFCFARWNLNSLAKDNFSRIELLQVLNSSYNYDILLICETSLNDEIELPSPLMEGYNF